MNILGENEDSIVSTFLSRKQKSENFLNKAMLNSSIEFILSTEWCDNPLILCQLKIIL